MSYNTIATMAHDGDLQQRFIACAAQEGEADPVSWVLGSIWTLVSDQAAIDSYQYAADQGLAAPGRRSDVVNDAKILSIVQARRAALATP